MTLFGLDMSIAEENNINTSRIDFMLYADAITNWVFYGETKSGGNLKYH